MYKLKKPKRFGKFLRKIINIKKVQNKGLSDPQPSLPTNEGERISKLNTEEAKLEARRVLGDIVELREKQEDLKKDSRKYQKALLAQFSIERKNKRMELYKIAEDSIGGAFALREIFSADFFDKQFSDWEEERKSCLYQLFMLFARPSPAKTEQVNNEILKWLAEEEKIEDIILDKTSIPMVHWLVINNNLAGVRWCFAWYHQRKEVEIGELVFEKADQYHNYWFNHLVDGLVDAIEAATYPQVEIIQIMLDEYEKSLASSTTDSVQRKKWVREKRETIKSLILAKTDLTFNLEEYFATSNELLVS